MIKEYKIEPYPRRLWVVSNENFDEIKDQFKFWDDINGYTHEYIICNFSAVVFRCSKDDYAGYLVFVTDEYNDSDLVHETGHITLSIYEDCDMELKRGMDQEPFCYLLSYIYKLIKDGLDN